MNMRQSQFCFATVLIASVFVYDLYSHRNDLLIDVARSWDRHLVEPTEGPSKILVGVNTNLDMVLSATDLLKAMNLRNSTPHDHPVLNTLVELEQLVAFSMHHCAGVERTFGNKTLFNNITSIAASLPHVYHIGGNAALIAEKLKSTRPEMDVVLIGPFGHRLKKLLLNDIITPTYGRDGAGDKDEIHMILEYSAGTQWGQVRSNCANRVIFSHDTSNSKMMALESVVDVYHQFMPDLVVLSGAHLLGSQKKAVWKPRLNTIAGILDTTLNLIPVHWELATIGNLDFFQELAHILFPRINSLGLNEQELLSVAKSSNAPFDFDSVPQKPGVEWVCDLLHWLMKTYSSLSGLTSSLTRVHLHSLSFHLIATVDDGPWSHSKEAVMAGARVAGLQACNTDLFNPDDFKLIHPQEFHMSRTDSFLSKNIIGGWSQWSRDKVSYYLSPVLVCKNPTKTVGLGDAISALGLIYSNYNNSGH